MKCTARALGSDVLTIVRAQEGTVARQWEIGSIISHRVTAGELTNFTDDIDTNKTDIAGNDVDIADIDGRVAVLESILEAPAGTKMYFYQNAAPAGWTYDNGVTDRILSVKGGAQAYNVNGGNQAGSWTQPDYTLQVADMPAHDHGGVTGAGGVHSHTFGGATPRYGSSVHADGYFGDELYGDVYQSSSPISIANSAAHTHTVSSEGGDGAHHHGNIYRPYAAVGIIATKD